MSLVSFKPARRNLLAAAAVSLMAGTAFAQSWPDKPVKLVVNFPAGGPADVIARSLGDALQTQFKQPFVVENKPGAGGNIGADAVAKAAPDGYTVLVGIDSTFTVNPHIYKGMPFKPADLRPVMVVGSSGMLVSVNPGTGIKSLAELVAAGKGKGVNFSSAGPGSPGHLAAAMAQDATGMKINHIPYKGNAPAVTAILGGEVDGGVLATPGLLPHVKAGKLTGLAVTSRKRSTLAPDIPTVAEGGLPQLEVLYMVMVPAATPDGIVQTLQRGVAAAMERPDVRARLQNIDLQQESLAGAQAAQRLDALRERYGKVIRATGMKVD